MATPSAEALRANEVNVLTTPFTCGCQASVAINIRIKGNPELWLIPSASDVRPMIFQACDVIDP
jgi:hypothetical protein